MLEKINKKEQDKEYRHTQKHQLHLHWYYIKKENEEKIEHKRKLLSLGMDSSWDVPAYDVRATLYGRWNDVEVLKKRRFSNVVLTLCAAG